MTVLVAYGTKHGSTREVAERVAQTLREESLAVEVAPAGRLGDVSEYDAVVLGGSLYTGRWHPDARHFLRRHRSELAGLPVAVFALGPRTLSERDVVGSRKQLDRALTDVPEVEPVAVAIFGGVVDPKKLRFPLNRLPASDARDWGAVAAWARGLSVDFRRELAFAAR